MKKYVLILILSTFVLIACSETDENGSTNSSGEESIQTTIIGGRTGGAWSVFSEGIAEAIRRENDGAIITVEPGGIVENPPAVNTGKLAYGLSYAMTSYAALVGNDPYKEPNEDIRAVSVVIPANYYQFIVKEEMEYDTIQEIIDNKAPIRLAVDQEGSAGEMITRNILQQYNVSYEDIISWGGSVDYLSGSKTFEMMADNRIDATGDAVSVPSSDIIEASTSIDLKMIPLDEQIAQKVSENLGMEPTTIEKGSYEFLDKDIHTLSTPVILLVHKDVEEEEVYQVTKAIYKNLDYLGSVHEEFKNLTAEKMTDVGEIPLHPGAEKFYQELGLMD